MTKAALEKWLADNALPDQWCISIGGEPPAPETVTLDDAMWTRASNPGQRVHLIHVTQAGMTPPPWVELEGAAVLQEPPPQLPPTQATPPKKLAVIVSKSLITKEKTSESLGIGCLVQGIGVLLMFFSGLFFFTTIFFFFGIVFFLAGFVVLVIGSRMATFWRCSVCKTKVHKDARVCVGCNGEFVNLTNYAPKTRWVFATTIFIIVFCGVCIVMYNNKTATPPEPPIMPAQVSAVGIWKIDTTISPIDDSQTVIGTLVADNSIKAGFGEHTPTMVLRYKEGKTEGYVNFGVFLGTDDIQATVRYGKEAAQEQKWSLSTDNTALFFDGDMNEVMAHLSKVDSFLIRVTPYDESPVTVSFTTVGVNKVIDAIHLAEAATKK